MTGSLPAWTKIISSTLLRMTRRQGGNAGKKLRSLRGLVQRLGYVTLAKGYSCLVEVLWLIWSIGEILQGEASDGV